MSRESMGKSGFGVPRASVKLVQAVLLALMVAFAVSSWAADERPVQSRVAPAYPEIAKRLKIGGVVRLEVTIDAAGKVTNVKTVSGNHMLSPAAEEAMRGWKFAPGTAPSIIQIDVNFALGN